MARRKEKTTNVWNMVDFKIFKCSFKRGRREKKETKFFNLLPQSVVFVEERLIYKEIAELGIIIMGAMNLTRD